MLLISADLDELIGLSDTIKVMLRGRFVADADPATVTPEELGAAMTGADGAADDGTGGGTRMNRTAPCCRPLLAIVFAAPAVRRRAAVVAAASPLDGAAA